MERRNFLGSALTVAGLTPLARLSRAADAMQQRWDYLIVGAGTAGLPAAIFASRRGARVLLIDAAPDIGGTMHMASGQISAGGSRLQDSKGIVDSPDRHYDDVMSITRGLANPDIVRSTVDNAPVMINWLLDNGLVPLPDHPTTGAGPGRPGYSVPRYLWGAAAGKAILAVIRPQLQPELDSGRVVTQLETRVTGLLTNESGGVEGVRAKSHGRELTFRGRHVLLTTGGYAMNPELVELLVGKPAYVAGSYPYSMGDGLQLAVSAGGWLRGRELHRAGTGSILTGASFPARVFSRFNTVPQQRPPWEIWVNNEGRRFIHEDEPLNNLRARAVATLPQLKYLIVFDEKIRRSAPPGIPDWTREKMLAHFDTHPMFSSADTLETLAKKAGIDAANLRDTIKDYNKAVRRGQDGLGRTHLPLPLAQPPFYAITHLGSSSTSSTGVVVDRELRVIRGNGEPIPNLYAAGEILGSGTTLGDAFTPGMMLTPALTLGRLLGERLPLGSPAGTSA